MEVLAQPILLGLAVGTLLLVARAVWMVVAAPSRWRRERRWRRMTREEQDALIGRRRERERRRVARLHRLMRR